ncbi:MAG: hypothetical protein ABWZ90_09695, partial [Acidimicrobiales bacterium]
ADVTEFPGRTQFEDRQVDDTTSQPTCPAGYTLADLDGDGVFESCAQSSDGGEPTPTTEPPTATTEPPPPTTEPPPPTTTIPAGPPGGVDLQRQRE